MRIVFTEHDGIYQQGNTMCHKARSVLAWFEEHEDKFIVLLWVTVLNSSDLNPIDNLLDHLDRVVCEMDPKTHNLGQLSKEVKWHGSKSVWVPTRISLSFFLLL